MRKNFGFVQKALVAVAAITAALIVAFVLTKHVWYDPILTVPERVSFWNEAFVAYGTLALAAVTVASVWETQQVLRAEDLRFRQSRMPMLRVAEAAPQWELGYKVSVTNEGDGPARDVKVRIRARLIVRYRYRDQETDTNKEADFSREVTAHFENVVSYLPKGGWQDVHLPCDIPKDVRDNRGEICHSIDVLELAYVDVFDANYTTIHATGSNDPPNLRDFKWTPPDALLQISVSTA